jgi:hypothetical protein
MSILLKSVSVEEHAPTSRSVISTVRVSILRRLVRVEIAAVASSDEAVSFKIFLCSLCVVDFCLLYQAPVFDQELQYACVAPTVPVQEPCPLSLSSGS